jgi:hypothetical protein
MWIFTAYGMYSVVQSFEDPKQVQVRARSRSHLASLQGLARRTYLLIDSDQMAVGTPDYDGRHGLQEFGEATIMVTPDRDYTFRIVTEKVVFAKLMECLAGGIDYTNFKSRLDSTPTHKASGYAEAAHRVHAVCADVFSPVRELLRGARRSMGTFVKRSRKMSNECCKGGGCKKPEEKDGLLVEDSTVVGGVDAATGAPVVRPKTPEGKADESVKPTDDREAGKK